LVNETGSAAPAAIGGRAVRNTTFVLGARLLSRLASLVVVVVLANALGADGYGRYTTLIALSALISVLADLGFNPLYTREGARNPREIGRYLGTLLLFKLVLAAAASAVLALALSSGSGLNGLILPGATLMVLTAYANLLRNTFYAVGRAGFDAIAILAEIAIQASLILYGAHAHASVTFYVWAYAASFGFTVVYALIVIKVFGLGTIRLGLDFRLVRGWLPLALPFALTFFLTNLYFRADVPILQHYRPFSEVGWYTFAYKPFEALQFIPLAVQAVVYPVLGVYFVSDQTRLKVTYERFFKALVLVGLPLTVGTVVLAHPIAQLFRLFDQSEPALRILAIAIVFLFANSAFYAMLNATDRQGLNAWATGLAAAINIGLNLLFIPLYGYLAASADTVVTEIALCAFGWWFVQRGRQHLRLAWLRLSWRIAVAGALMGAVLIPLASFPIYVSVLAGALTYALAVYGLRVIEPDEWRSLRAGLLTHRFAKA
jgi:O-antigen/teichoic acid export membrane protein